MTYGDYRPSYHTIKPYNGYIYVVSHDYSSETPDEVLNWYATGEKASTFWTRAGGFQHGIEVTGMRQGAFHDSTGRICLVLSDPHGPPERTTRQTVPCPAHRKSKHPTVYRNGYWYKETRHGWERL